MFDWWRYQIFCWNVSVALYKLWDWDWANRVWSPVFIPWCYPLFWQRSSSNGKCLWLYCSLQVATPYLGNTLGLDHPRCIWWWSTCAVYLPYRFLSHTTLTILAWGSWQWWYFCIECSFGLVSSAAFPIGSKSSLSWFLLIQTLLASSAIGQEFHPTDCC